MQVRQARQARRQTHTMRRAQLHTVPRALFLMALLLVVLRVLVVLPVLFLIPMGIRHTALNPSALTGTV